MKNFLLLIAVAAGGYWWWTHRAPEAEVKPALTQLATPVPAPNKSVVAGVTSQTSQAPAAPATGGSWPRRQIDRAQAAANAAKTQHEGL